MKMKEIRYLIHAVNLEMSSFLWNFQAILTYRHLENSPLYFNFSVYRNLKMLIVCF